MNASLKNNKKERTDRVQGNSAKRSFSPSFADLPYDKQIQEKTKRLNELLGKYGKVEEIRRMEEPLHYRFKVHAAFGRDGRGRILCGAYKEGTHKIIPVEDSPIEDTACAAVVRTVYRLVRSFRIKVYDEDLRTGLLRHVVVRRGYATGEILVVLVTAENVFPSVKGFVRELIKAHPEIRTVVQNVNAAKTSRILGERERVIYGPGYIEDSVCGCTFRISASSFYQVNPLQTDILYRTAVMLAGFKDGETVLDTYCGTGTIGIVSAKLSDKKIKITGVERNGAAVADARDNAKRNGIRNISFVKADSSDFMEHMASKGEAPDVLLMDPPREGCDKRFLAAAASLAPSRAVYISCNPETLARDMSFFAKNGYKVLRICPVDMFPFTEHVETVVLLSRK